MQIYLLWTRLQSIRDLPKTMQSWSQFVEWQCASQERGRTLLDTIRPKFLFRGGQKSLTYRSKALFEIGIEGPDAKTLVDAILYTFRLVKEVRSTRRRRACPLHQFYRVLRTPTKRSFDWKAHANYTIFNTSNKENKF